MADLNQINESLNLNNLSLNPLSLKYLNDDPMFKVTEEYWKKTKK